jgi:hypothetical protein
MNTVDGTGWSTRAQKALRIRESCEPGFRRASWYYVRDLCAESFCREFVIRAGIILPQPIRDRLILKQLSEILRLFVENMGYSIKDMSFVIRVAPIKTT